MYQPVFQKCLCVLPADLNDIFYIIKSEVWWHCSGIPNVMGNPGWAWLGRLPRFLYSFFKKEAIGNLKCMLLSERSQSEKATYCVIPKIGHSGKGKLWRQQKDEWLPELGCRVWWIGRAQRIFRAVKIHDIVMIDICPCTFIQTCRMYTTKSEP